MNPDETIFTEFDMSTFEDFQLRESFEEEDFGGNSTSSSFSDSYTEMPVYRSISVLPDHDVFGMESQSGLDKVYVVPFLSRADQTNKRPVNISLKEDDLFKSLELELSPTSLPSCGDCFEGSISPTSFELAIPLVEVTNLVCTFLQEQRIHSEHVSAGYRWNCEHNNLVDNIKFQIQIYSTSTVGSFLIEFLRISGASLLFSETFRTFKSENTEGPIFRPIHVATCPSVDLDLSDAQDGIKSIIEWASKDSEAVMSVCGLLANNNCSSLSASTSSKKPSEQTDVLFFSLVAALCMKIAEEAQSKLHQSSLPLLFLMKLLVAAKERINPLSSTRDSSAYQVLMSMTDKLIPSVARISLSNHVSAYSKMVAGALMETS